ncbi:hypothetical protein AN958_12015 [Leucoagaricus sp. SymC.cos]|nr:hypothetical protein AN958_12015 [Leucoagaricus sp. SymC.cos]
MPEDLRRKEGDQVILQRSLVLADMKALEKYASRVRVFCESEQPSVSIYRVLCSFCLNYLLPRLETLIWRVEEPEAFSYIRFFLSPTLKGVSLYPSKALSSDSLGILSSMPVLFFSDVSQLKLSIPCFSGTGMRVSDLSRALFNWKSLSELDAWGVPIDTIRCVVELPKLRHLRLSLTCQPSVSQALHGPIPVSSNPQKSALETIFIEEITSITLLSQIMTLCHFYKLRSLQLVFQEASNPQGTFETLSAAIIDSCDRKSLETLHFQFKLSDIPSFRTLTNPFFTFSELRNFSISSESYPTTLSQQEVEEIASAWPQLELLALTSVHSNTPAITLSSLISVARKCPNINFLRLTLDASNSSARHDLREQPGMLLGAQNYTLRKLYLTRSSPITHKEFVASLLATIFPNLESIVLIPLGSTVSSRMYHHRWKEVTDLLLPFLNRAREMHYLALGTSPPYAVHVEDSARDSFLNRARINFDKTELRDEDLSDVE